MALYRVDDVYDWLNRQIELSDQGKESDRKAEMTQRFRYYDEGTGDELRQIKAYGGGYEPDDNLSAKLYKTSIDAGRRAIIKNGKELISLADKEQNKRFQSLMRRMHMPIKIIDMFTLGAIGGHVYTLLGRDERGTPCMWVKDPQNITVIYDPDDYTQVLAYVDHWLPSDESPARRQVIWREIEIGDDGHKVLTDKWHVDDYIADSAAQVKRDGWLEVSVSEWEHDWCPMHDWPNLNEALSYYGAPDIDEQDIKLIRGFNRNLSHANRMGRAHADPLRYAYGVPTLDEGRPAAREGQDLLDNWKRSVQQQGSSGPDDVGHATRLNNGDILILDDENGFVKALEAHGDQTGLITMAKFIRELFMQQTSTLLMTPELFANLRELNGKAFKAFYGPISEKADDKVVHYEHGLSELIIHLMEMNGEVIDYMDLVFSWPQIVPVNESEELTNAQKELDLGVSRHTVLRKLGIDPVLEQKLALMQAEHDAKIAKIMAEAVVQPVDEAAADNAANEADKAKEKPKKDEQS